MDSRRTLEFLIDDLKRIRQASVAASKELLANAAIDYLIANDRLCRFYLHQLYTKTTKLDREVLKEQHSELDYSAVYDNFSKVAEHVLDQAKEFAEHTSQARGVEGGEALLRSLRSVGAPTVDGLQMLLRALEYAKYSALDAHGLTLSLSQSARANRTADAIDSILTSSEEAKIPWDISDLLYNESRTKTFDDCRRFGLEMTIPRMAPQYKKFDEALDNGSRLLLDLLKRKVQLDLAAVLTVSEAGDRKKHDHLIRRRLNEASQEILEAFRGALLHWAEYFAPFVLKGVNSEEDLTPLHKEELGIRVQTALNPFQESVADMVANTSDAQADAGIFEQVRGLVERAVPNPTRGRSSSAQPLSLRVFLASPGDVSEERAHALKVLEQLPYAPGLRGKVTLEVVAWDKPGAGTPMLATLTPQEAIAQGLPKPAECDIVVVILWARMGTPLPPQYTKGDGSRYLSGTEWEYWNAVEGRKEAKTRPEIVVYRRKGEPTFKPSELKGEHSPLAQWRNVETFFAAFRNLDGSICGGVNEYDTPERFRATLDEHLKRIVFRLIEAGRPAMTEPGRLIEAGRRAMTEPGQVPRRIEESIDRLLTGLLTQNENIDFTALVPPNRDDFMRPVPLEKLYVAEVLTRLAPDTLPESLSHAEETVDLDSLVRDPDGGRVLIAANPGTGKSTCLRMLAMKHAREILRQGRAAALVPVLVELKTYDSSGRDLELSEFLLNHLRRSIGLESDEDPRDVLARAGYAILWLLDGVDEILDATKRASVADQITKLLTDGASARRQAAVIASRILGLQYGTFRRHRFERLSLRPFDDDRIQEFISKWFSLTETDADRISQGRDRIQRLRNTSNSVNQLLENPMLLTIVCIIARHDELPSRRTELYRHSVEVLCWYWEAQHALSSRGRRLLDRDDTMALLLRIAWRMFSTTAGSSNLVLSSSDLRCELLDFFAERRVSGGEALEAVNYVIDQLMERNFILTRLGPEQYGFVHRTFAEYLCAASFLRQFEHDRTLSQQHLVDFFAKNLPDSTWTEVLRLLVSMVHTKVARQVISESVTATDDAQVIARKIRAAFIIVAENERLDNRQGLALMLLERLAPFLTGDHGFMSTAHNLARDLEVALWSAAQELRRGNDFDGVGDFEHAILRGPVNAATVEGVHAFACLISLLFGSDAKRLAARAEDRLKLASSPGDAAVWADLLAECDPVVARAWRDRLQGDAESDTLSGWQARGLDHGFACEETKIRSDRRTLPAPSASMKPSAGSGDMPIAAVDPPNRP